MPSSPILTLPGAPNFRDLGGYAGDAGRGVRRHRLFRSDHLANLAPADLALLSAALGEPLRVLDLRGEAERASAACSIPGVTVHALCIEPTIVQKLSDLIAAGHDLSGGDVASLMQDTYRGFVRHSTHQFQALFGHLLESDVPTVFHCTAGKDRTGFAAALILLSLGVSQDEVMRDYLLTNDRLRPPAVARHGLTPQAAAVLWQVQPEFLNAAFAAVDENYGGLERYFCEGLGLGQAERERLRQLYLSPR